MSDRKLQPDQPSPETGPAAGEEAADSFGREAQAAEDQTPGSTEGGTEDAPDDAVAAALRERDEYLDLLRRERAEFENYRRRATREHGEAMDRGAEQLIARLLGVLDNFGYVLEAAKDSSDQALAKGTEMVHEELLAVLRHAGLQVVPGVGEPFDPVHHEAMMQVEAAEPLEHPVVAEVLRTGYRFKERLLRPASVSVAQ